RSARDRGVACGWRAMNGIGGWELWDGAALRERLERLLYGGRGDGFGAVGAANRSFSAVTRLPRPARQSPARATQLFDLAPDEEQQMLRDAIGAFAEERVRPAALAADAACATPAGSLEQAAELGIATLGVPDELG